MSWDLTNISHKGAGAREAPPRPRGEGIVFQPARRERLSAAADASVALFQEKERPCVFCGGKGRFASGGICPVCSGRGVVRVQPPTVSCAFCHGRGQSPPRSGLTCWVCKGRGVVPVRGLVKTCPDCHGAGRRRTESLYCRQCGGAGVVGQ